MRRIIFFALASLTASLSAESSAYEKALAHYERKNFDACVTALKSAIKDAGEAADMRILAAHCHTARKSYADAIYHLKAVLKDAPERTGIRTDIVNLLFQSGKYREGRNSGYKYIEAFKDEDKVPPAELALATAKNCLAYGKVSEALALARDAKQSSDANTKYSGLITETRALIAQANLTEADISLSFAESMRENEVHALLRANIAELTWAQQKFPEDKRAEIVALYEKITRSENSEIKAAAQKNLERVKNAKAS